MTSIFESMPISNKRKRAFRSLVWRFFLSIDEIEKTYLQIGKGKFKFV